MTVEEAVRIVREQTIPALAGSGGGGHADALETVLAALEDQSKRADDWFAKAETLEAERDEARAEVERLRAALEIIAGKRQCLDNLMSNAEVARAALDPAQPEVGPAPCRICGYSGPGYYQPESHPCAAPAQPEEQP